MKTQSQGNFLQKAGKTLLYINTYLNSAPSRTTKVTLAIAHLGGIFTVHPSTVLSVHIYGAYFIEI
jgi:hypothetical protein